MTQTRYAARLILSIVLLGLFMYGGWWFLRSVWLTFAALPKEVAVALLTAATTVIVATGTVVGGRYLERKKEFAAVHRDKKIPIYDEFIKNILRHLMAESGTTPDEAPVDAVRMFREWQRQILLWGGPEVVNAYLRWKKVLSTSPQTIEVLTRTDELFLAIRRELGHDDRKLEKHAFVGFILREPEIYMAAVKANPKLLMQQLVELEQKLKTP